MKYSEYRTLQHYKLQWEYQPKTLLLFIVIVYLLTCFLVCSVYIIISPLIIRCWSHMRKYCPIKIKRRTFCFCNFARRRLVKILKSIYDSQTQWQPLSPGNLEEQTKTCIMLIKNETCTTLECDQIEYALVGSSAEGLGKSYVLDLQNSYKDQWCRFLLRFFCCCLPCNTSFSCLRTDIDVIMKYNDRASQNSYKPSIRYHSKTKTSIKTDQSQSLFNLEECTHSPGFTKVVLNADVPKSLAASWQNFCKSSSNGKSYLSSSVIRKGVFDSVNSIDEHSLPASRIFGPLKHPPFIELETKGPAVKLTLSPIGQAWYWNENQKFVIFEADLVFGIHSHKPWPPCAQGWASRSRFWPSPTDIAHLTGSGYVLVAKSSKTSEGHENDLEWLISFPHCETYLSSRIPRVARACYLALKIILKDHLTYVCESLKTYQLKTVLFWELEKHPLEFWDIGNIEECFLCLFDAFRVCIERRHCPSYWLEDHNLLYDCDQHELTELLLVLTKIRSNPAPYVEDLGSMWC
ncbi:cyclic GMP-AMP synthase-like receptor 2 isoform X2 [Argopecten irradians]|uniref:cyclic GMP-AMP synthase-like receptor 2 isoform X2 n=1 Tax=Argopecten irradians TaxID=31199 RepID=UPI0037239431